MTPFSEHKDRSEVLGNGESPCRAPIEEVIGTIIREARTLREVTQESLADAIGCSRTTIVNIEMHRQGVTLAMLYDIAFALDLMVYDLLPDGQDFDTSAVIIELSQARQEVKNLRRRLTRAKEILDGDR